MKRPFPSILLTAAALAGTATALPAAAQFAKPEDAIKYRQSAMFLQAQHMGRIGAMVNGRVPFDAKAVADNAEVLATVTKLRVLSRHQQLIRLDFEDNFAADLAAGTYRYMWITPDMCNNMHDCDAKVADAWLKKTVDQIMASDAYKNGGAIFVLFDEGSLRILNAGADLATIVISPNLVEPGYSTDTRFDHRSYLATIEDIFEMPRLATTKDATPMDEFFKMKK